ncbi:MAG: hypothetical protein BWZ10_00225 [candidate division BRC1 bacterium ADurb.BinA364]|nr:MAG: hypothetical protein BWZ10_00225 [candidate division BRC1 bacterium ADurb.BinA364]
MPAADRKSDKTLLVVEPQCRGVEHADFNAAMIASLSVAYPDCRIAFFAQREHASLVLQKLQSAKPEGARFASLHNASVPRKSRNIISRYLAEKSLIARAIASMPAQSIAALWFVSSTPFTMYILDNVFEKTAERVAAYGVVHGGLASMQNRFANWPWSWGFFWKKALGSASRCAMQLFVLGECIRQELQARWPALAARILSLDFPHFLAEMQNAPAGAAQKIRFGVIGGQAGLFEIAALARSSGDLRENASFSHAGFVRNAWQAKSIRDIFSDVSTLPLPDEEFDRRIGGFTYAVFCQNSDHYRLCASAAFIEAFCRGLPCIALRNNYISDFVRRYGDIGHVCESAADIRKTMQEVSARFPLDRYFKQRNNILNGRKSFAPESIGKAIAAAVRRIGEEKS